MILAIIELNCNTDHSYIKQGVPKEAAFSKNTHFKLNLYHKTIYLRHRSRDSVSPVCGIFS